MKKIAIEEIIEYKILPFSIYSEFGEKIFSAGEVLTPGKLLQLKHLDGVFRDENEKEAQAQDAEEIITSLDSTLDFGTDNTENFSKVEDKATADQKAEKESTTPKKSSEEEIDFESLSMEDIEAAIAKQAEEAEKAELAEPTTTSNVIKKADDYSPVIIETFDMNPSTIQRNKLSVDDIDISNYQGPINKRSRIDGQTQLKIKAFYQKTLDNIEENKTPSEILGMFANIRDKIVQDIVAYSAQVRMSSQLKLLGEYNRCHALNTAILSGIVAKHMELPESKIYDIVLAGLLHDIGKLKIPIELRDKVNVSGPELVELHRHTQLGYRMLRAEMELPEHIAQVALDHHEFNDGSGYPSGKSGDRINIETQIVAVCNYFDNLTSNRTPYQIRNTKEALRIMLQMGTKKFSAKALYTFVHMFSYNDTTSFEDMIL